MSSAPVRARGPAIIRTIQSGLDLSRPKDLVLTRRFAEEHPVRLPGLRQRAYASASALKIRYTAEAHHDLLDAFEHGMHGDPVATARLADRPTTVIYPRPSAVDESVISGSLAWGGRAFQLRLGS